MAKIARLHMEDLTAIEGTHLDIEPYLARAGEVFKAFREQDSGCVSYGVLAGGRRYFVKHSSDPRGLETLGRAQRLYAAVQHAALPRLHNVFRTPGGMALVLDWLPGELLYKHSGGRDQDGRKQLASSHTRFRALPPSEIIAALDTIYAAHLLLAEHGFVAVDFYDGSIIYDFEDRRVYLCDLDEYRPGPFVLEADRLAGSRRFMAPEEWVRGSVIDQVSNVYTLGRTALELLGDGSILPEAWRGSWALLEVAKRAASPDRADRYPSVSAFVQAWKSVAKGGIL